MALLTGLSLLHAIPIIMGNNFPPVVNRVPIPGIAVSAPLNIPRSELYFGGGVPVPSNRFIAGPSYGFIPSRSSQVPSQRDDILEEFERLYESGQPAVGPVATPTPDHNSQERADATPKIPDDGTMVIQPPNVWVSGKSNGFAFQRVIPVLPPQNQAFKNAKDNSEILMPVFPVKKQPNPIRIWSRGPQIIQPLPSTKSFNSKNSKESSSKEVRESQSTVSNQKFPQLGLIEVLPSLKPGAAIASQLIPAPKIFVSPNTIKSDNPQIISAVPARNGLPPNVLGWVVNPYGQLSQIRTLPISSPNVKSGGESTLAVLPVDARDQKVLPPVPIANTWVLRQGPNGPYFDQLRTLLPSPVNAVRKSSGFVTVSDKGNSQSKESQKNDTTERQDTIVFDRGSEEFFDKIQVLQPLPHSPKSDVLVIGKGSTVAHLAPQQNILPNPPNQKSELKPCDMPKPELIPSAIIPVDDISISRKGLPNDDPRRAFRPFSAYIQNPDPRYYILPQSDQRRDSSEQEIQLPMNAIPLSQVITRNRFTHPFRYTTRLFNYNQPDVFDLQDVKPANVEVIPPPVPEFDSSKREDSSEHTPSPASIETSSADSAEKIDPKHSSAEEAEIVERLHAHASNPVPSVVKYAAADKKKEQTKPYSFGFDQRDHHGVIQHRQETADILGIVRGSYGYRDAHGNYRQVEYVADKDGFKPKVKTVKDSGTHIAHGEHESSSEVTHSKPSAKETEHSKHHKDT